MAKLQKGVRHDLQQVERALSEALAYLQGASGVAFEMDEDRCTGADYNRRNLTADDDVIGSPKHVRVFSFTGSKVAMFWGARDRLRRILESCD